MYLLTALFYFHMSLLNYTACRGFTSKKKKKMKKRNERSHVRTLSFRRFDLTAFHRFVGPLKETKKHVNGKFPELRLVGGGVGVEPRLLFSTVYDYCEARGLIRASV